jgi:hypothetical protein
MSFKLNTLTRTMLCALAGVLAVARAGADPIIGGTTTFTTAPGIESLYSSLNISASLIPPASGNLQSDPQTLILPITGGDTTTELDHSGGVMLQAAGQIVDITNVVIHISGFDANKVTADLSSHGVTENLAVADISGSNTLIADPSFVAQIRAAGGPDLTGTTLATFKSQPELAPTATPEPGQMGLISAGLLAFTAVKMGQKLRNRVRVA